MTSRNRIKTLLSLAIVALMLIVQSVAAKKIPAQLPDPDGKPADVASMLEQAARALHEEKKAAAEKRRSVRATARYRTKTVDPFDILDIEPRREKAWHRGRVPTDPQRAMLQRNGAWQDDLTFTQASTLIGEIIGRRESGKCSFKQAKILRQFGYSTDATFEQAGEIIDQLKANGWRRK